MILALIVGRTNFLLLMKKNTDGSANAKFDTIVESIQNEKNVTKEQEATLLKISGACSSTDGSGGEHHGAN